MVRAGVRGSVSVVARAERRGEVAVPDTPSPPRVSFSKTHSALKFPWITLSPSSILQLRKLRPQEGRDLLEATEQVGWMR